MQTFRVYSQPFGRRRTKTRKMGVALCSAVVVVVCLCVSSVVAEKSSSNIKNPGVGNSSSKNSIVANSNIKNPVVGNSNISLSAAVSKTFGSKVSTDFPSSATVLTTNFATLKNTTFKIGASKKYYMKYASSTTTTTTVGTASTSAATSTVGTTPAPSLSTTSSATKRPTTFRTTVKPAIVSKTTAASTVTTEEVPPPPPPTPLVPPPTAPPSLPPRKVENKSKNESRNTSSGSTLLPDAQPLIQEMDVTIPDQIAEGSDHFMNVVAPPSTGTGPTAQKRSDGGQGFMPPLSSNGRFEKFGVQDSLLYKNNEVIPPSSTGPGSSGAFGEDSNRNYGLGGPPPPNYGGTPQPHRLATTFQHSGGFTGGSNNYNNRQHNSAPPQPTSGGAYQFPSAVNTNGFHNSNPFSGSKNSGSIGFSHGHSHNHQPHRSTKTGHGNVQTYSPYSTLVQNKDPYQPQNSGPPRPSSYSSNLHNSPQSPGYQGGNIGGGFGFPSSAPQVPSKFPTTMNPFGPPNSWQPSAPSQRGPVYPGHTTKRSDRVGKELKHHNSGTRNDINPSKPIHFSNSDDDNNNDYGPGPANNFGPPVGPPSSSSPQNGPGFLGSFDAGDIPPVIDEPPSHQHHAPESNEEFGSGRPEPNSPPTPVLRPQGFAPPQHHPQQNGGFNAYDSSSSAALSGVDGGQNHKTQDNPRNQEPDLPLGGPPLNEFNTQRIPHHSDHSPSQPQSGDPSGTHHHHSPGHKNQDESPFGSLSNIEQGFGDFRGFKGSNIPHAESSQANSGQEDNDGFDNFIGGREPPHRTPKKHQGPNFDPPQQFPPPPKHFDDPRHGLSSFHNAPSHGTGRHIGSPMPDPEYKNFPGERGTPNHGAQSNGFNEGFGGRPKHSAQSNRFKEGFGGPPKHSSQPNGFNEGFGGPPKHSTQPNGFIGGFEGPPKHSSQPNRFNEGFGGPPKHSTQPNGFNEGFGGPPGGVHDAPQLPRTHGFEGFSGSGTGVRQQPGQFNTGLPGGNSLSGFHGFGSKQNQAGSSENSGSGSSESGGGSGAPSEVENEPPANGDSGGNSDEQPQALPQIGFGPGGGGHRGRGPHFAGSPPNGFVGIPDEGGHGSGPPLPPQHLQGHPPAGFGGFPVEGNNVGPGLPGPRQFSPSHDGFSSHQNSGPPPTRHSGFRGFGGSSHPGPVPPQHTSKHPTPEFGPFYIDPNQIGPQASQQNPGQATPEFGDFTGPNHSGPVPTQHSSRHPKPGLGPFYVDPNLGGSQTPRYGSGQSAPRDYNRPKHPKSSPPHHTSPSGFSDFTNSDQAGPPQNLPSKDFGPPPHGFGGPQQYHSIDSPSPDFSVPPPKSQGPPSTDYIVPSQQINDHTQHGFAAPTPPSQNHPFQGFDAPELPIYPQGPINLQDQVDKDVGGPSSEDIQQEAPPLSLHQSPVLTFNDLGGNSHGQDAHGPPHYNEQSPLQSDNPGFQEFGNFPGKHAHLILKPDEAPQGNPDEFQGSTLNHPQIGNSPQVISLQGPPQVVTFQDPPQQASFQDTDTSASNSIELGAPGFSGGPGLHGFGPGPFDHSGGPGGPSHNPVDDLEMHHPGLGPSDSAIVNVPGSGFVGGTSAFGEPDESPQVGSIDVYGPGPGGPQGGSPFSPSSGGPIENSQNDPNGGVSPFGPGPDGPFGGPQDSPNGGGSTFGPGPGGPFGGPQGSPNGGGSTFGPGPGGPFGGPQGSPNGGGSTFGPGPGGPFGGPQGSPNGGGSTFGPGPGGPFGGPQGSPNGGGSTFGPGPGGPFGGGPQGSPNGGGSPYGPGPASPNNRPQGGSGPIGVGSDGSGPASHIQAGSGDNHHDHNHDDHHHDIDHHPGPVGHHHPEGHGHKVPLKAVFPIGLKKVVLNPLKLLGGLKKPIIGPVKFFGGIKPIHGKLKTFGSHANSLGPGNSFGSFSNAGRPASGFGGFNNAGGPVNGFGGFNNAGGPINGFGGFNNAGGPVNGFGGGFNKPGGLGGGLVKNPVVAVPLKAIDGLKHAVGGIKHAVAIPVKGIVNGIKKPIVGPVKGLGVGIGHGGGPLKGLGLLKGILDGKGKFPLDHKVAKVIKVLLDLGFKIVSFYAKLSIPKDHYLRVISFAGIYLLLGWLFKDSDHLLYPKCEKWGWNGPEEFTYHAPARFVPAVPVDQHMQQELFEMFRGIEGCLDKKVAEDKKKKKKRKKEKEKKKRNKNRNRGKDKDNSNSSSEEDEEEDDKDSGESNYSVEIGHINDMCPRNQFFFSMSPYHIEAWQSLSQMFKAQETPADVFQLARTLLHDRSVNPKVWYLGLAAASAERPDMTGFTLANPIDAFPDMYVPGHLIEGEMQRYRGLLPRVKRSALQKINVTSASKFTKVINKKGSLSYVMLENRTTTTVIPTTNVPETDYMSGIASNSTDDRINKISAKSSQSIMRRKGEADDESDEDDDTDDDDGSDSEDMEDKRRKKHPLGYGHGYIGDGYGGFNKQNTNSGVGGNRFGSGNGGGGIFGSGNGGGGIFGGLFGGNRNKGKDKDKSKEKGKKGKGKKKDKKKCIIVDGSVGLDNGLENKLWYFREDMMVSQHHAYWHQIYANNASQHGDRRAEIFFFMHRSFLARYNAERLSNGFARTLELGLYPGAIIDEGYDPHLKDFNSGLWWAPRAPNTPLSDILHLDDPDYARDIIIGDVIGLYNNFVKAIKLGKLLTADGKFLPIRFHEGINPLGNTIEATNLSVNPLYYDVFGIHNLGHFLVGLAADPDWSKRLPSGVMSEAAVSMRDPAFYTYHTILDNLFEKFKQTLPPYKPYGGVWPLQWHGVEINDVKLVSHSGGEANLLTTFYIKHKFQLEPGVDRTIEKGIEKADICAVHLDHAPFQFQISIDRKKCAKSKSGQGTVRIFMAPRYDEEGHRFSLQEQRRLMFQLDAFQVELKVGRNIITRNSRDNSLTRPWSKSLSEYMRGPDPSGAAEYCGCGWPHHLFIPKGNTKGMAFDLFVMVTNFDEDYVANHPKDMELPEMCNSPYIFCGLPRRRYPDSRPMGYPFDRPPHLVPAKSCGHGNGLDPKNLLCKLAGKIFQRPVATLEEYVSGATNMAMTVFEIKHIPKVVGKHYG